MWLSMLGPKPTRLTLRMPQSLTSPIIATLRPLSPGIPRKLLTLTITHGHSLINTLLVGSHGDRSNRPTTTGNQNRHLIFFFFFGGGGVRERTLSSKFWMEDATQALIIPPLINQLLFVVVREREMRIAARNEALQTATEQLQLKIQQKVCT